MAHNWTYYYTRLGHADHIQKIYMYLKTGSSFTLSRLIWLRDFFNKKLLWLIPSDVLLEFY